jgi:hypothetical protein
MSQLSLPGPREGDADDGNAARFSDDTSENIHGAQHDGARRRSKMHVASEEECLAALSQLPGFVVMGLMTTSQANTLRATYNTILQYHQKRQAGGRGQSVDNAGLVDVLRKHPGLASALEPFLSDEQIAMLLKEAKDGNSHETD